MHTVTDQLVTTDGGGRTKAYGMIACFTLANTNQAATLTNADSFNIFATMVYFPQAVWGGDKPE